MPWPRVPALAEHLFPAQQAARPGDGWASVAVTRSPLQPPRPRPEAAPWRERLQVGTGRRPQPVWLPRALGREDLEARSGLGGGAPTDGSARSLQCRQIHVVRSRPFPGEVSRAVQVTVARRPQHLQDYSVFANWSAAPPPPSGSASVESVPWQQASHTEHSILWAVAGVRISAPSWPSGLPPSGWPTLSVCSVPPWPLGLLPPRGCREPCCRRRVCSPLRDPLPLVLRGRAQSRTAGWHRGSGHLS